MLTNFQSIQGEELAAAFLGALVAIVADTLPSRNRRNPRALLNAWELDTPNLPKESTRHKNFIAVCALAKQKLSAAKEAVINLRATITLKSSISTTETPRVTVDWYADLYDLFCDQTFKAFAGELRKNGHNFFLIAFDECTALNMGDPKIRSPKYHMSLIALQRIIKAADNAEFATPGVQFWYPFLDTGSAISDLYPKRGDQAPSWRFAGELDPLPPWPHMGFDQLLQEEYNSFSGPPNPSNVLSFDHLKHYGRPVRHFQYTVLHAVFMIYCWFSIGPPCTQEMFLMRPSESSLVQRTSVQVCPTTCLPLSLEGSPMTARA